MGMSLCLVQFSPTKHLVVAELCLWGRLKIRLIMGINHAVGFALFSVIVLRIAWDH